MAELQGKNNKFGARQKIRLSGRLGREEVYIGLAEQSVVETSGCVCNSKKENNCKIIQNNSFNGC